MRLKVLTTTLLIASVLIMLSWPMAVGPRPSVHSSKKVKALWGQRGILYFGVTSGVLLSTAMSALLLFRQTRREFLEQEKDNLKSLIEGTLRDHDRKS